jgi:guanylate kinase
MASGNSLERLEEFQKVLKGYHISAAGEQLLKKVKLVVMVGPSGAGRNTIINALVKTGGYHFMVSDTTRKPRINNGVPERDGREYWFRTEDEVLADLKAGKFLEAAIIHNQQVSGISLRELEKAKAMDEVAVNEIEIVGARNIIASKPDTYVLFVVPPSFSIWMQRLEGRGKLSRAEKKRRLESAVKEFEAALTNDYYTFIVNDTFEHSVERIHELVLEGRHAEHQDHGRDVAEKLLIETEAYLRKHA